MGFRTQLSAVNHRGAWFQKISVVLLHIFRPGLQIALQCRSCVNTCAGCCEDFSRLQCCVHVETFDTARLVTYCTVTACAYACPGSDLRRYDPGDHPCVHIRDHPSLFFCVARIFLVLQQSRLDFPTRVYST
jgi:hypothetical protein